DATHISKAHVQEQQHTVHGQQHTVHTASVTQKRATPEAIAAAIAGDATHISKAHVQEQQHTVHGQQHTVHTASVTQKRATPVGKEKSSEGDERSGRRSLDPTSETRGKENEWKGYKLLDSPTPVALHRELASLKKASIDTLLLDIKRLRSEYRSPQESEMLNSAILYTLCSYADLSYALNNVNGDNLHAAVSEILSECRKSVEKGEKDIGTKTYKILRNVIPEALSRNGIECRNVNNPLFEIKNGKIRSLTPLLTDGFSSAYGYGRYMDNLIEHSVSEVGDISKRSSLDSSINLRLNDLPLLVMALDNVKTDRGSLPVPEKDSGPIPQADGMVLLKHIYNMSSITGATWKITKAQDAKAALEQDEKLSIHSGSEKPGTHSPEAKQKQGSVRLSEEMEKEIELYAKAMEGILSTDSDVSEKDLPKSSPAAPAASTAKNNRQQGR
ncbi:hypothetical protein, partial [Anaplasma bovis]|uniref:hypothetical protein n=1 Tax=Anaplasma bovis TaxID=186733 RepID=UPI002FEF1A32